MANNQKIQKMSVSDFNSQIEREEIMGNIRSIKDGIDTAISALLRYGDNEQLRSLIVHLDYCLVGCRDYVKHVLCDEQ